MGCALACNLTMPCRCDQGDMEEWVQSGPKEEIGVMCTQKPCLSETMNDLER